VRARRPGGRRYSGVDLNDLLHPGDAQHAVDVRADVDQAHRAFPAVEAPLAEQQGAYPARIEELDLTEAQQDECRAVVDQRVEVLLELRRGLEVEPLSADGILKIVDDDLSMSADVVDGLRAIMELKK